ncbi:MAG: c-type cytochrome [Humidesulfovibrio sp.]|nr:c-type cytochrome [Humidesulfovibrio sp.]
MKKLALSLALSLAVVFAASAALAADAQAIFARCAGCHGADGTKTLMGNPVLKGLKADVIAKALSGYKAKTFGGPKKAIMEAQAAGLSDADIKALAAYISKL